MKYIYLGRQSLYDKNSTLVNYEIFYRDGYEEKTGVSNRYVSSAVVTAVLNKFGVKELLQNYKTFIKVDEKLLMNDLIFIIPKEFFIFSLVDIVVSEKTIERLEHLEELGYDLAINDLELGHSDFEQYINILHLFSYVKLNFNKKFTKSFTIIELIRVLKKYKIKTIATKIETKSQFNYAKELGLDLFQGYFVDEPKTFKYPSYDAPLTNILKLYSMLIEDKNVDELTAEFEKNYEITLQLLRYVNSGVFDFKDKITSLHNILTIVGRIHLSQWLMLMIYSKSVSKDKITSPMIYNIRERTQTMQWVLTEINPEARSNMLGQIYFIGLLSFIENIFRKKIEIILKNMNVDEIIKDALFDNKGILGEVYLLVKNMEVYNPNEIRDFAKKYNLDTKIIEKLNTKSKEMTNLLKDSI